MSGCKEGKVDSWNLRQSLRSFVSPFGREFTHLGLVWDNGLCAWFDRVAAHGLFGCTHLGLVRDDGLCAWFDWVAAHGLFGCTVDELGVVLHHLWQTVRRLVINCDLIGRLQLRLTTDKMVQYKVHLHVTFISKWRKDRTRKDANRPPANRTCFVMKKSLKKTEVRVCVWWGPMHHGKWSHGGPLPFPCQQERLETLHSRNFDGGR